MPIPQMTVQLGSDGVAGGVRIYIVEDFRCRGISRISARIVAGYGNHNLFHEGFSSVNIILFVGDTGLEPVTSCMSSKHSDQLS